MKIICVQHHPVERAAAIADWAASRGHEFEVRQAWEGCLDEIVRVDALILMGGPMSVCDMNEHPWIVGELAWLREQIANGVPVFGVCLGAQMIACAMGGEVRRQEEPEIGWYPIELKLIQDGLCLVMEEQQSVYHWHAEYATVPEGGELLATSVACSNQAFRIRKGVIGLQFHLEIGRDEIELMCREFHHALEFEGEWIQGREAQLEGAVRHGQGCRRALYVLLDQWIGVDVRGGAVDSTGNCVRCGAPGAFYCGAMFICDTCREGAGSCCPEFGKDDLWQ